MFLLGGVFFPLAAFPAVVQNASWATPLRPAVEMIRGLFKGDFGSEMWLAMGIMLAYIVVFLPVTLVTMRRRLTK
jgi:ABC-type multidrug transport system permease subunit